MSNGWRDGDELDIHREMMQTTLAIATRTLFGVDLGPQMPVVAGALDAFIRQNAGLNVWQLIFKLPTPSAGVIYGAYARWTRSSTASSASGVPAAWAMTCSPTFCARRTSTAAS